MAEPIGRRLEQPPAAAGGDAAGRRRARARIESPVVPGASLPDAAGRRLSAEERAALRDRARSRGAPSQTDAAPRLVDAGAARPRTSKPPPTMPRSEPDGTVRSRGMVALGTVLIIGLTILAFAGGRLFGSPPSRAAAETPTPLPVAIAVGSPRATPALAALPEPPPAPPAPGARPPVVCLDPGHGGEDRGFSRGPFGPFPVMEEATLVLEHAWDLEARLRQRGYEVVLTRRTDEAVNAAGADVNGDGRTAVDDTPGNNRFATLDDLQARIDICNAARADLLVSMHVNGYTTQRPRGYETWFTRERPFGDRNASFATLAYAHLKEQLRAIGYTLPPEEERGVNPDTAANVMMEHSLFKHFIITGPAVPGAVDPSDMPGAIVEALFVSNDGDAAVLASPEGRDAIVTAYENAIVEYFDWFPPGT
jgi:N-acetylmuramoyl-L-alanine amidase